MPENTQSVIAVENPPPSRTMPAAFTLREPTAALTVQFSITLASPRTVPTSADAPKPFTVPSTVRSFRVAPDMKRNGATPIPSAISRLSV